MSVKIREYRGTPYSRKDLEEGRVPAFRDKPRARYAWACGPAMGRFLAELKEGRIIGRRCRRCGRVLVPPRMFCEWCFRPTDEWVYVRDTGTVLTFSASYLGPAAERLKEPIIIAVIQLDGASPGIGILHKLGEVKQEEVHVGMRVKAVWKPPEEREGAITDILYFKPIREGQGGGE
ncbi:MAG TPA: Zn-ribbon domain-containing OB-fold protein [Candidatus Bathyarchaeota archaeon]|nr:Zn-ribbon domain-containing OB-fold protein [Candidatus Bathyarchaeota archaeon]